MSHPFATLGHHNANYYYLILIPYLESSPPHPSPFNMNQLLSLGIQVNSTTTNLNMFYSTITYNNKSCGKGYLKDTAFVSAA